MTISAAAQGIPIVAVSVGLPLVDKSGMLANNAKLALQQLHDYVVSINRTIPCNASAALDTITLALLPSQPTVDRYIAYESFAFVASNTSAGPVSALVRTTTGALATLKVFKNNGVQAGSGDIVQNSLYRFIYNDALDSGGGGFVIDGTVAASVTSLTDSSGGIAGDTIVAVSGTGDDTNINDNFASISAKVDALISAIGAV